MELLYEQFIRERQYLLNVSVKTVEAYRCHHHETIIAPDQPGTVAIHKGSCDQTYNRIHGTTVMGFDLDNYLIRLLALGAFVCSGPVTSPMDGYQD